jgi:hypothetical protein
MMLMVGDVWRQVSLSSTRLGVGYFDRRGVGRVMAQAAWVVPGSVKERGSAARVAAPLLEVDCCDGARARARAAGAPARRASARVDPAVLSAGRRGAKSRAALSAHTRTH